MDRSGDEFFPGAGFAKDQDGAFGLCDLMNGEADSFHRLTFPGEQAQIAFVLGGVAKVGAFVPVAFQIGDSRLQFGDAGISVGAAWARRIRHAAILSRASPWLCNTIADHALVCVAVGRRLLAQAVGGELFLAP